jgi:Shikimate kinase
MEDLGAREVIKVPREEIAELYRHSELFDADILVNGTPVGMYPHIDDLVADISPFTKLSCVVDVIYNPYNTRLLIEAQKRKIKAVNGLKMLAAQAKASSEIFLGAKVDNKVIKEIYNQIRKESVNIVFVGMGGSGKTTVATQIANDFGMEILDTDKLIEAKTGKSILQIFDEQMEDGFRKYEKAVINEVAKLHNKVIATGGGSVIDEKNCIRLKANGILVYIKCNPDQIDFRNRPCYASRESAKRIYAKRSRLYEAVADITVENHIFKKSVKELVEEVKNGIAGYQRG